jgi:hypothetical protein
MLSEIEMSAGRVHESVVVVTPDSQTTLTKDSEGAQHASAATPSFMRHYSKRKYIVAIASGALLFGSVFLALRNAGNYLIVDNPAKSDVILVPARGLPLRYDRGLDFMRNGYGGHVIADVPAFTYFGHPVPELAQQYFSQQPDLAGKVDVCVVNLTLPESEQAAKCLEKFQPKSVLIVTGQFETRLTLKVFSHDLPQYRWSVTPAQRRRQYPVKWWTNGIVAKTVFLEWYQLVWWEFFSK